MTTERQKRESENVSEEFLDAVLSEMSFYGPLIKSMARELRERRHADAEFARVMGMEAADV